MDIQKRCSQVCCACGNRWLVHGFQPEDKKCLPRSKLQDNSTEENSTQVEAGGEHHPAVLLSATLVPHLWHVNWKAPELELSWLERQILLCIMPGVPRATVCRLLFDNFAS